jgi:hypothetical protein
VFVAGIAKAQPFFTMPPVGMLPTLAFEPSKVEERGWVLLFNALLTTDVSLMQPLDTRLSRGLQWNIWMLMEDSDFFLDASEISIQALLLVATHGQDISTPSLCWTLISNACRMAQTLALHLPTAHTPKGSDANLQRNCLFWSLFIIDKSLSLSFGRPPLLPGYLYKNIPPPDPTFLAKYRPHQELHALSSSQKTSSEEFGVVYITQVLALAKLQGDVSDYLNTVGISDPARIHTLKAELDSWIQATTKVSAAFTLSMFCLLTIVLVHLGTRERSG